MCAGSKVKATSPWRWAGLAVRRLRAAMSLTEGRGRATASWPAGKVVQAIGHMIDGGRGQGRGYGVGWEGAPT